jgi:hypothetical protein
MQPLRLVAIRDLPVRELELAVECQALSGMFQPSEILRIGSLEESAFVRGTAPRAMVLHRKQAMPGWTFNAELGRIATLMGTRWARVSVTGGCSLRPFEEVCAVRAADAPSLFGQCGDLDKIMATGAGENKVWMPRISGD